MKKYHSPASAALRQPVIKLNRVRVLLILALVAGLSSLPFYVFAQDDGALVKAKRSSSYVARTEGGVFVMYQQENGDTVCRDATISESRALRAADASQHDLQQINHLTDGKSASAVSIDAPTANLTIILRATQQLDANPTAKAAFIAAAAKWEALIKDPITVIIDVDYGPTFFGEAFSGPNILGATATQQIAFENNYVDVRNRLISHASSPAETTLYNALPASSLPTNLGTVNTVFAATPIFRALGAIDAVANPPSEVSFGDPPKIAFNSGFSFDFDPSDGITGNRTDFDAVAVHEMGHALGFDSSVGLQEIAPGTPLSANVWDLFRFRPGAANLNNFNTVQRILSTDGTQVQFAGGPELELSTGNPNGNNGDGEQASHWKDDALNGGFFIGIMDPTIIHNRREELMDNDKNAIDSFGFTLSAIPAPPNDNFANSANLSGATGTTTGTNTGSSKETGEPIQPQSQTPPFRVGGSSVWYHWTATGNGQTTIDTIGSNFDTTLAVYTGSALTALTLIGANDDISAITDPDPRNVQSRVIFNATAGTTYRIQVDGYNPTDTGAITLHWSGPAGATPTPTPTPGPNTVQFTVSTASATEAFHATTKVDLQVTRTGDTALPAKVNYATSDATASERSDYEATLGTLQFGAGEASKTVTVFIIDDALGEPPQTFNVTLSNPVACTLGSPVAVTVTINSDEASNGTNPVKAATFDTDFFVRQHYLDFFNREPDAPGLAFWKNQIDECTTDQCREIRRINVSAAFFLSIEFQQTGYLVYKTYQASFDTHEFLRLRDFLPDTQEIGRGVVFGQQGADALLEANKVRFFNDFVQRATFLAPAAYPTSLTAAQFVDKLNANTYDPSAPGGGSLTQGQRDALVAQLSADPTSVTLRAQVLRSVAENSVFHDRQFNRAFVLTQYFGYLRRNPNDPPELNLDFGGYNFWLGKLQQFNGNYINAEMVKAFITAIEYEARFGP